MAKGISEERLAEIRQELIEKFGSATPKKPRQVSPKTWKQDYLDKYGVVHIADNDELPYGNNVIYCTSCAGTKSPDVKFGVPKEIYTARLNQQFYNHMEKVGVPYATLSGHLGMIFWDDAFETYDDGHTSDIAFEERFMDYAQIIKKQCDDRGIDTVVFCYSSPLMSEPFIRRLYYTGLKVYYVTKISMIQGKK